MSKLYTTLFGEYDNSLVALSGPHKFTHYSEVESLLDATTIVDGIPVSHANVVTFNHGEMDVEIIKR